MKPGSFGMRFVLGFLELSLCRVEKDLSWAGLL